jgi:predicted PurR-regulated permease PerM
MNDHQKSGDSERMNSPDVNQQAAPIDKKWAPLSRIHTVVLATATVLGIYLCYRLAIPFLPALAWSVALAVLFAPLQRWLELKLHRPNLAAIVSVLLIALIVVVPLTFLGQRLVVQATESAALVETKVKSGEWRSALDAQPRLAPIVDVVEQQIDLPGTLRTFAGWLSNAAGSIVKGSVFQLIGFFLTFYLLFFFLRDRRAILDSVRSLSPLSDAEMALLFARIADTIHATIYGTLAVSAMQGLLGGLMFWWLGLAAPLLWGLVMALLAIVPMLGAFIVWVPAAIFLALEGSWGKALILTAWGVLVVGTIDNLMRPILVGNRLKLHTVLAFMSVVGGLILFGPAGLILGPVTLSVTLVLLEVWRNRMGLATELPTKTEP